MTRSEFQWYAAMAFLIAVVVHGFVRRYWLATMISASIPSSINVAHELVKREFEVRPSDVAFWVPMWFIIGCLVALPVVAIVGVPFVVIRRQRKADVP